MHILQHVTKAHLWLLRWQMLQDIERSSRTIINSATALPSRISWIWSTAYYSIKCLKAVDWCLLQEAKGDWLYPSKFSDLSDEVFNDFCICPACSHLNTVHLSAISAFLHVTNGTEAIFCSLKFLEKSRRLSCKHSCTERMHCCCIYPIISHNVSLIQCMVTDTQHSWFTLAYAFFSLYLPSIPLFYNYQLRLANLSIVPVSSIDSSLIYVIMALQSPTGGVDSSKLVAIAIDITLSYMISLYAAITSLQGST